MHGMVFLELKKYVESRHGKKTWDVLLNEAGLPSKMYTALTGYPDSELMALVAAASRLTGTAAPEIVEDFGVFIAPGLLQGYKHLIQPNWRTLDVIENTEVVIHAVVRRSSPGAAPPQLHVTRIDSNQVMLAYDSPRRLCFLAKGIANGIARHFGERLEIHEGACMHRGDPRCEIRISRIA